MPRAAVCVTRWYWPSASGLEMTTSRTGPSPSFWYSAESPMTKTCAGASQISSVTSAKCSCEPPPLGCGKRQTKVSGSPCVTTMSTTVPTCLPGPCEVRRLTDEPKTMIGAGAPSTRPGDARCRRRRRLAATSLIRPTCSMRMSYVLSSPDETVAIMTDFHSAPAPEW